MRGAVMLVLAGLLLAGCSGKAPAAEPVQTADTGSLRGSVVDAAFAPVVGAFVRALDHNTTTDKNGDWRLDDLAPGTYFIEVSKPGFLNASVAAAVVAGQLSEPVRLTMAHAPTAAVFVVASTWEGFIECSVRLGTGGAGGSLGINVCNDIGRQDVNHPQDFPDGTPDWYQMELVWQSSQTAGSDLSLIVGPQDCTDTDWHRRDGPSPLYYTMDSFELDARTIGPDIGLCTRVFTWTSGDLMHVWGMQIQQGFTTFSHAFYNAVPEPAWQFSVHGGP